MGGFKGRRPTLVKQANRSDVLDGRRTGRTTRLGPNRRSSSAAPLGSPPMPPPHPDQARRAEASTGPAQVQPNPQQRSKRAYPESPTLSNEEKERTAARVAAPVPGQYKPPPTYEPEARAEIAKKVAAQGRQAAIHASHYLDGQTGWRARMTPRVKAFISSKAAAELNEGNKLGASLQPRKDSIDTTNPQTESGSKAADAGQDASSRARKYRGGTAVAAATTTVAFGDPVTTSAVATVGGAMETWARRRAERAHREAESGYARGAEDPDITSDKRAAIESEAVHQSHLADRAMRQKQKAAATTLFGAIPGINFMATGAEQTATGIAAEAARKTFEGGKNTKEAVAET